MHYQLHKEYLETSWAEGALLVQGCNHLCDHLVNMFILLIPALCPPPLTAFCRTCPPSITLQLPQRSTSKVLRDAEMHEPVVAAQDSAPVYTLKLHVPVKDFVAGSTQSILWSALVSILIRVMNVNRLLRWIACCTTAYLSSILEHAPAVPQEWRSPQLLSSTHAPLPAFQHLSCHLSDPQHQSYIVSPHPSPQAY